MDFRAILLGVTFALMWSSAFSSARIIVAVAPPLTTLSIRFFIAGLIGVAIAKFLGQTFKLTKGQRKSTIIFGIFQNAFYLGLNFIAMQTVGSIPCFNYRFFYAIDGGFCRLGYLS